LVVPPTSSIPSARSSLLALDMFGITIAVAIGSTPGPFAGADATLAWCSRLLLWLLCWTLFAERLGIYLPHNLRTQIARGLSPLGALALAVPTASVIEPHLHPVGASSTPTIAFAAGVLLILFRFLPGPWQRRPPIASQQRILQIGSAPLDADAAHMPPTAQATWLIPFPGEQLPRGANNALAAATLADLDVLLRELHPEMIWLRPSPDTQTQHVRRALQVCAESGVQVHCFAGTTPPLDAAPAIAASPSTRELSLAGFSKRVVDILGASIAIVALSPILIAAALAVKCTSRGPILFRQERTGQDGRTFGCLKFRTMRLGAHAQQESLRALSIQDGPAFKIPKDPRLTRIGGFLRRYSLDELPQLFNVLFGTMSLVGPRPPIPGEVELYQWWQRRRVSVKPGITCLWQVVGRNRVPFQRWVEMDLYYIDNWSFWLDASLLLRTLPAVLRGTGM
jgi:exopolysaccharide biosynthesis polyprenyl glycosylphosphotransferase